MDITMSELESTWLSRYGTHACTLFVFTSCKLSVYILTLIAYVKLLLDYMAVEHQSLTAAGSIFLTECIVKATYCIYNDNLVYN